MSQTFPALTRLGKWVNDLINYSPPPLGIPPPASPRGPLPARRTTAGRRFWTKRRRCCAPRSVRFGGWGGMRTSISGRCLIKRKRHKERLRPPHHPPLLQGPRPAAEQEAEHGAAAAAGGEEPPSGPHRRSPDRVAKGSRVPAHNAIKRDVPKLEAKAGDPHHLFFWIFSIFIMFPPLAMYLERLSKYTGVPTGTILVAIAGLGGVRERASPLVCVQMCV